MKNLLFSFVLGLIMFFVAFYSVGLIFTIIGVPVTVMSVIAAAYVVLYGGMNLAFYRQAS